LRPLEKLGRASLAVLIVAIGYLLFWPVPIRPRGWRPPPDPGQSGPYVANGDLRSAALVPVGNAPDDVAPETAALDPRDGWIYTGLANGWIMRVDPASGRGERGGARPPRPPTARSTSRTRRAASSPSAATGVRTAWPTA
jgi:hypothetical protein